LNSKTLPSNRMKTLKTLWVAFAVILCTGISAIIFLPLLPIDETRCLSVAWEMWLHKSFLVPLLNGMPYSHKPPLLFWLIHLSWWFFGVNEITPRVIPMLFSMFNCILLYKISLLLWPGKDETAKAAALLLSTTLIWLVWSFLILYEMLLSFWVLLAVFGILTSYRTGKMRGWIWVSLGIGGGILTKGPVVLVHVAPLLVMAFWWGRFQKNSLLSWYGKSLAAILLGVALTGLWVIPAVIKGGEVYRHAILWHQTAERIVHSFAHRRSALWYFPVIPIVLLPWIFMKRAWDGFFSKVRIREEGWRICTTWFLATLTILSLVSGKQIYYLIPSIPAVILLFARNITRREEMGHSKDWKAWGFGVFLILIGISVFCLPMSHLNINSGSRMPWKVAIPLAGILTGFGIVFLIRRFKSPDGLLKMAAICMAVIASLSIATAGRGILKNFNLKPLAKIIKTRMASGNCVAFIGGYHGEFQFLGRLDKPLVQLKGNHYVSFLKKHPNCLVIDRIEKTLLKRLKKETFYYIKPFRVRKMIFMVKGSDYLDYFGSQK